MNNASPPTLAAPGPAPHPARALAACVDGILATMRHFLARLGFLGRLIDPQAAHLAHLLQSLSTLLARFAAGDLPLPAAPLPATTLAPSRTSPRASSPASPLHNVPPCAPRADPRHRLGATFRQARATALRHGPAPPRQSRAPLTPSRPRAPASSAPRGLFHNSPSRPHHPATPKMFR